MVSLESPWISKDDGPTCRRYSTKTAIDMFSMMAIYSFHIRGHPIVVDGERSPSDRVFLAASTPPAIRTPFPIHGFVPFWSALSGAVQSYHAACGSRDPRPELP